MAAKLDNTSAEGTKASIDDTSKASTAHKTRSAAADEASVAREASDEDLLALAPEERTKRVERIIQDHVLLGVASGLVPGPGIDLAVGFGIQLTMLARMAKLYGIPFRRELAKKLVSSFFGSLGGVGAGIIAASSLMKAVPGLGTVLGFVGMSGSIGAFTYAVGKVFQAHFESGGSLVDLDPRAYGTYFREMFQRGKDVVARKKAKSQDGSVADLERPGSAKANAAA